MTDPVSLTFGVIGTAGVALHSARRTKEFIDGIRGAPRSVNVLSNDLRSLENVLETLEGLLKNRDIVDGGGPAQVIPLLRAPLDNCISTLEELRIKVKPFTKPSGDAKTSKWRGFTWTFREKDITDVRTVLMSYKSSLDIAVSVANLSTSASGVREVREVRFQVRGLQKQLAEDQASVADPSFLGSDHVGSDHGFALRRFLLDTETILGDSTPASPDISASPDLPLSGQDFSGAPSSADRWATLYEPPWDLMYQKGWDNAVEEARENKKFLLVNIQYKTTVAVAINAHLWKEPSVVETVQANFIFLLFLDTDIGAKQYLDLHFPQHGDRGYYPHIAVVDPSTGRQLKVWSGDGEITPASYFLKQLQDFLNQHAEARIDQGSLAAIFEDSPGRVQQPLVQCVQVKPIVAQQGAPERYRVVFSDIQNFVQTMLVIAANHYVTQGGLRRGCFVRLKTYKALEIKGKRILLVMDLDMIKELGECEKLGDPKGLAEIEKQNENMA